MRAEGLAQHAGGHGALGAHHHGGRKYVSSFATTITLVLLLMPVLCLDAVSLMLWPAILLVDLLIIGLAIFTGALIPVLAALALTLITAGAWLFRLPANTAGGLGMFLIVLGGFAAASAAHARSDVSFSVGLNVPGVYVQPAPVYVPPAPVYVQPAPVYRPAPVYVQPAPVYVRPAPIYYGYGGHRHHHGRPGMNHGRGGNGDWDRDGVPNRFDRAPGNPYYR